MGKWVPPASWMDLYNSQRLLPYPSPERLAITKEMEIIMRDEWLPISIVNMIPAMQVHWDFVQNYNLVGVPPNYDNEKWEQVWCTGGKCE